MVLRPRFEIREESNLVLGPTNPPFYAVADFMIGAAILTGVAV